MQVAQRAVNEAMEQDTPAAKRIRDSLGLSEEEWLHFLLDEGLEVLTAFRSIADRSVRQMFLHRMQEAGARHRNKSIKFN